ncbi:MAG: hypothetical protein ACI4EX_09915 [Lachnospiraceae bacterium]
MPYIERDLNPEAVMTIPGDNVMVEQAIINNPLDLVDLEALYEKKIVPSGYVNENKQGNYHEGIEAKRRYLNG